MTDLVEVFQEHFEGSDDLRQYLNDIHEDVDSYSFPLYRVSIIEYPAGEDGPLDQRYVLRFENKNTDIVRFLVVPVSWDPWGYPDVSGSLFRVFEAEVIEKVVEDYVRI